MTFQATPEVLIAHANKWRENAGVIGSTVGSAVSQIQGLSGSAYAGKANDVLQQVIVEINEGMRRITEAQNEIADTTTRAAGAYVADSEDGAAAMQRAGGDATPGPVVAALRA